MSYNIPSMVIGSIVKTIENALDSPFLSIDQKKYLQESNAGL